jgi:hypothetical protein
MRTPQSLRGGTMLTSSTFNFFSTSTALGRFNGSQAAWMTRPVGFKPAAVQTEFKRITIKQVPHPVDVVPGTVVLTAHVAGTKSMNVIELNQAQLLREKFATEFHGARNDRLFARAV